MFGKIGIYHHPAQAAARALGEELRPELSAGGAEVWLSSAWDPVTSTQDLPGTDLLICIGGDGTVLRAARAVIPNPTLILGVDMGRLAFLTEVTPADLRARLPDLLAGKYHVEERAMLEVGLSGFGAEMPEVGHALNDVILGRTSLGRPVYINVKVNGDLIGLIRADAVVVASATGSTAYSLSAGGPILDPLSRSLVITPVAPHLAAAAPIVLPQDTVIDLSPATDGAVAVSVDGQGQYSMTLGSSVRVRRSEHLARLVRFGQQPFFAQLGRRLAWLDERRLDAVGEGALDQESNLGIDSKYDRGR
ncbi:MAG: NAD(+)/NADH kinase [Dehalococcoidia bacterium]